MESKKDLGKRAPEQYIYRIMCNRKLGKVGKVGKIQIMICNGELIPWELVPPLCFTFRIQDFRFL
jgi:hypothetical protein